MKVKQLFLVGLILSTSAAHAHRVWVTSNHTHGGEVLKAELGYGEFPELEPIAKDRLHIFRKPMQLITERGKEDLQQKGQYNYQYESKNRLKTAAIWWPPNINRLSGRKTKKAGNRRI